MSSLNPGHLPSEDQGATLETYLASCVPPAQSAGLGLPLINIDDMKPIKSIGIGGASTVVSAVLNAGPAVVTVALKMSSSQRAFLTGHNPVWQLDQVSKQTRFEVLQVLMYH